MNLSEKLALAVMHRMDPEAAHGLSIQALKAGLTPRPGPVTSPRLQTEIAGLDLPNPVGLAAGFDKNAEALAENEERTVKEKETLAEMLDEARNQLKMARLLGYGDKKAYKPIYEQIDQIEKKSEGGKSGKGWFDKIKQQLSDLI